MFDELKELIMNYVSVPEDEINEDSRFAEDLGFNSYDFMCMLGDAEDAFDIEMTRQRLPRTRQSAVCSPILRDCADDEDNNSERAAL